MLFLDGDLELDVEFVGGRGDYDFRLSVGRESFRGSCDCVSAGSEVFDFVEPQLIGLDLKLFATTVCDSDGRIGDDGAAGIENLSAETARGLRNERNGGGEQKGEQKGVLDHDCFQVLLGSAFAALSAEVPVGEEVDGFCAGSGGEDGFDTADERDCGAVFGGDDKDSVTFLEIRELQRGGAG